MSSPTFDEYLERFAFTSQTFFDAFSNSHCSPHAVAQQRPIQYLFRYLTELQVQMLVVERVYVDGDYLDDYSSYYSRCFQDYDRLCRRLHFFSVTYDHSELLDILVGEPSEAALQDFSGQYVGFVVVRPLPTAVIGRTVLKTYASDDGRRCYPCVKTYHSNVFGQTLDIQSLAFQQQDSVLAACATVALWSCYHKTAELFGTACPRPAAITSVANQVVGLSRPFPSGGLRIDQICNSIRALDLDPEVFMVNQHLPVVSLIYGYMKMGIPVLLVVDIQGVGGHALTLVGYSLAPQTILSEPLSLQLVGAKIDKFYAHDDQVGPYSRLIVKPPLGQEQYPAAVSFEGDWSSSKDGTVLPMTPHAVIVPVYNKIRLKFTDILPPLKRFNELLGYLGQNCGAAEWDVHLITTQSYKEEIKSQRIHEQLSAILLAPHPRFIWRAILRVEDRMVLELLADATDVQLNSPFYQCTVFDAALKTLLEVVLNEAHSPPGVVQRLRILLTDPFYRFLQHQMFD